MLPAMLWTAISDLCLTKTRSPKFKNVCIPLSGLRRVDRKPSPRIHGAISSGRGFAVNHLLGTVGKGLVSRWAMMKAVFSAMR